MHRVYYDLETSGLSHSSEILQIAVLEVEDNNIQLHSQYFMPHGDISPGAIRVHGLNRSKLEILSEGLTFEEGIHDILEKLTTPGAIICGYNSSVFDDRVLATNLAGVNYCGKQVRTERDVLKKVRAANIPGSHKLGVMLTYALNKLNSTYEEFNNYFTEVCREDKSLHNAAYDVFATYIVDTVIED